MVSDKKREISQEPVMEYTFEILGVSPVLYFFSQQQDIIHTNPQAGVEYIGTYKCTLDAFIKSAESVPPKRGWDFEQVVETMVNFWVNQSDTICYWKARLADAGKDNLLVARLADIEGLQQNFEFLLGKSS